MKEDDLITAFEKGGKEREKATQFIYLSEGFRLPIKRYILSHGGTIHDWEGIFIDGICELDASIRMGKYRRESNLKGFLYAICRNLWRSHLRKTKKHLPTEIPEFQDTNDVESVELYFIQSEKEGILNTILKKLGEQCQKILSLWALSYKMQEIAEKLNLSSAEVAKTYKNRCMKQLRELVSANEDLQHYLNG